MISEKALLSRIWFLSLALMIPFLVVFSGSYLYGRFQTNLVALVLSRQAPRSFLEKGRNLEQICAKPLPESNEPMGIQCSTSDRCFFQGISDLSSGDWDAAQASLLRTSNPLGKYFSGWAAWCAGDSDRALQEWTQYAPSLSQRFRDIGEDFLINKDTPQAALPWLTLANDIQPGSAATLTLMGTACAKTGSLERAADLYNMAIATGNASGDAYTGAAEVEYGLGRVEQAKQHIRAAIQLEPNGWLNWQIYGNMLLDENKPSEAAAWYRRVISVQPDYAQAHATLSIALLRQGKLEDSLRPMLEAMHLVQDSGKKGEYLETWIQVARNSHDPGKIADLVEQTLIGDPRNTDLLAILVRAENVAGRCQEAAGRYAELESLAQGQQGVVLPAIDRTCSGQK